MIKQKKGRIFEKVMKIAVITRHGIANYGSLLQAFATQKAVEKLGYSCQIIDYIRNDESYLEHEKTLLRRKKEWYVNPIKRMLYLMLRQPESIIAGRKFEKAQRAFLNLSKRYDSYAALESNPPLADIYMTGSDQVWGPTEDGTYDPAYCLSFTEGKKIAYAASFGHASLDDDLKMYFKKRLLQYKSITVREDKAVDMLQEIGISAKQVLDPTLLFDANFWSKYAVPIKEKGYILIYQLHNDKKIGEYAKKVARDMGLPLVRISSSFHQCIRQGKFKYVPKIGEFLSYIKNAECLITDSFHGTAFAINFNTLFVEVLPNTSTESRNISILKMTGLTNRILQDVNDIDLATCPIDFATVNNVLKSKRKSSFDILKDMIEN